MDMHSKDAVLLLPWRRIWHTNPGNDGMIVVDEGFCGDLDHYFGRLPSGAGYSRTPAKSSAVGGNKLHECVRRIGGEMPISQGLGLHSDRTKYTAVSQHTHTVPE